MISYTYPKNKEGLEMVEKRLEKILKTCLTEGNVSKDDCVYLLSFPETSFEAGLIKAVADGLSRKKAENSGLILGQVGIDVSPCEGNCKFCVFGETQTVFKEQSLTDEEIVKEAKALCDGGDLYALFLMAMHNYDKDKMIHAIKLVRKEIPSHTQIWVNVGDSDLDTFNEFKAAGADGAYHVCRLREGIDTDLNKEDRIQTMKNIAASGVDLYTCCEPIGPEHSNEELVENMFIGIELGCFQHAAMRRIAVPGVPLESKGQITEMRLAHIVAVLTLATIPSETVKYMSIHEPTLLGLVAGANVVTAERGANPRDLEAHTDEGRGLDMTGCRTMLYESGFTSLRRGDDTMIPLTIDYIKEKKH